MRKTFCLLAILSFFSGVSLAVGADLPGTQDPPGFKRYEGSQIIHVFSPGYVEYRLDRDGGWDKTQTIEGNLNRYVYLVPDGHTSLEIFRNYEQMLSEAGFHRTFELKSDGVSVLESYFYQQFFFGPEKYDASNPPSAYQYGGRAKVPEYATYEGVIGGKTVTVAVLVGQSDALGWQEPASKQPTPIKAGQVVVALDVVTGQTVANKMVVVKAEDIAASLAKSGKIDLYGIYFDVDKSDIKPESNETLGEIAKLLKIDTSLKLEVSGHTDNTGKPDHNMKLSQARAAAVVHALATNYGLDAKRLVAKGYGDTKPVEANTTEDGRAKNRRVELRKI
jgi:outer membrane protein OmpA-like peptidoglycan-associated protein